ncbi:hypothetical protein LINGRAHAP2_LOCUS31781 [Linum grandiflorum]
MGFFSILTKSFTSAFPHKRMSRRQRQKQRTPSTCYHLVRCTTMRIQSPLSPLTRLVGFSRGWIWLASMHLARC